MGNNKIFRGIIMFLASVTVIMGFVSIFNRVGGYFSQPANRVVAETTQTERVTSAATEKNEKSTAATQKTTLSKGTSSTEVQPTTSSGKNYPVNEIQYGKDGIVYKNISVKNYTSHSVDLASELKKNLGFKIKDSHQVQVLIFHTHSCESYLKEDTGYYPEDYYPRTTNDKENVVSVGDKIAKELKAAGIGVIHAKDHHDYPSYNGSYDRSYETISDYMNKYKNIKVVLDIHRDAIGLGGESGKTKPVFTINGKKAAQIMIMTGNEYEGGGDFPFWQDNLRFAIKLQKTAEDMFPGITRPLNFGDYTYNMNVCNGSLLIEVGTDVNTLEEAQRTGTMLGKALARVLQNN